MDDLNTYHGAREFLDLIDKIDGTIRQDIGDHAMPTTRCDEPVYTIVPIEVIEPKIKMQQKEDALPPQKPKKSNKQRTKTVRKRSNMKRKKKKASYATQTRVAMPMTHGSDDIQQPLLLRPPPKKNTHPTAPHMCSTRRNEQKRPWLPRKVPRVLRLNTPKLNIERSTIKDIQHPRVKKVMVRFILFMNRGIR
eukprot:1141445_1